MNSHSHPRKTPQGESGFVLVGVTMFILVLTILGLSLFSLSGFEGQFMIRSLNHDRAFNAAAGGIERARFALLAPPHDLEVVKAGDIDGDGRPTTYMDGVDYAVAIQNSLPVADSDGDSTNNVVEGGDPVWIRVRARSGDASVVLQARFSAGTSEENYRRLITARRVSISNKTQTYISGKVGQPSDHAPYMAWYTSPPPIPTDTPGPGLLEILDSPLELPQLASYHALPSTPITAGVGGTYVLDAGLIPTNPKRFRMASPMSGDYTVDDTNGNPTIWVSGTAVWLLPARAQGSVRFRHRVTVNPLPGAPPTTVLVILAGTRSGSTVDIPEVQSVFLDGGIWSGTPNTPYPLDLLTGVPIVIVTPGIVVIGNGTSTNDASFTKYLSIYAGRVEIHGPVAGPATHLWNLPSMNELVPDEVMDLLYDLGILPNAGVTGQFLSFDTGSWLVLSESSN